jgi:dGTPase
MSFGITYAVYATDARRSRGRLNAEPESPVRSVFQRDRDRVVHSAAFRRLKHKTQVFVAHEGDHYRTRLTHSLEVAQIARTICRQLGLDEDLAECVALAHDLGHTPFGHAGEEALNAAMEPFGGFDHNSQTLRILTQLECKYATFNGLNLCWETLEGVVKHNGPLVGRHATGRKPVPQPILDYNTRFDLALDSWPGPEAQVAALADDIAYNNHDIDDGLRAGLFTVDDLHQVPLVGEMFATVARTYSALEPPRLIHESVRRLIDRMVRDLLAETRARVAQATPRSVEDVRARGAALVAFSPHLQTDLRALREFLHERMYRHWKVNRMTSKARRIVSDLFALFSSEPELLPEPWRSRAPAAGSADTARLAADYIAGMTDRFALDEHHRLFDPAALS